MKEIEFKNTCIEKQIEKLQMNIELANKSFELKFKTFKDFLDTQSNQMKLFMD